MARRREALLRRYLKRLGITLTAYREWVGDRKNEPVEAFFEWNSNWTVSQWKKLVREHRARMRG